MYVFPLLKHPENHQQEQQQQQQQQAPSTLGELTSFFPFDPYKLPRSSAYIDPIYREWSSVAIGVDDDDDEEEEEEEPEVEEDGDGGAESDQGLGASFGEMKISPAPGAPVHHHPHVALGISSIVG